MYMYLSSFMFFALNCYYSYAKILIIGNYQNRLNVSIPFHGKYISIQSKSGIMKAKRS